MMSGEDGNDEPSPLLRTHLHLGCNQRKREKEREREKETGRLLDVSVSLSAESTIFSLLHFLLLLMIRETVRHFHMESG